jgi:adenosylhomocysteine nucleosidase
MIFDKGWLMNKLVGLLIGFLFLNVAYSHDRTGHTIQYAVLVPMHDESMQLLEDIQNKQDKVIDGVLYTEGTLNGIPIVFANTGLGKTNVSLITARLIHDYHPKFLFLAGSSGTINPNIENYPVVVGERVMDADLGTLTAQGTTFPSDEYFTTPQKDDLPIPQSYAPDAQLMTAAQFIIEKSLAKAVLGSIATSDVLPNPAGQTELLKRNKIDVVEMEGASFMQACWLFNKQCLVVRGVSNHVDEEITKEGTIRAGTDATRFVALLIEVLERFKVES